LTPSSGPFNASEWTYEFWSDSGSRLRQPDRFRLLFREAFLLLAVASRPAIAALLNQLTGLVEAAHLKSLSGPLSVPVRSSGLTTSEHRKFEAELPDLTFALFSAIGVWTLAYYLIAVEAD
jgi:hypothetical protein